MWPEFDWRTEIKERITTFFDFVEGLDLAEVVKQKVEDLKMSILVYVYLLSVLERKSQEVGKDEERY